VGVSIHSEHHRRGRGCSVGLETSNLHNNKNESRYFFQHISCNHNPFGSVRSPPPAAELKRISEKKYREAFPGLCFNKKSDDAFHVNV
jgi:hypothetical protein